MKKSSVDLLNDSIQQLKLVTSQLQVAYAVCKDIKLDQLLNDEDLLKLEALTARFGRLFDMFISKLLRIIDLCELSSEGTIIDLMNRAEKKGLIKSAADLRVLKELRNDVVHEYQIINLVSHHESIFKSVPELISMVNASIKYAEELASKLKS